MSAKLDHMPIRQLLTLCKRAINPRLIVASFALLTLLTMQNSLIWHALDHLRLVPAQSLAQSSVDAAELVLKPVQKETTSEATCLKCLEDLAHAFALPSSWSLELAHTVHVQSLAALAPNQIFLSPERANQRGPPTLV